MRIILCLVFVQFLVTDFAFADYKEGDTLKFWSVSYADWITGELPKQKEITAVCRKMGAHSYIFLDTAFAVSIPDSVFQYYSDTFDNKYYKLTDLYGPVPDALDNDPRIFILVINPEWWAGYFDPIQQMPDTMTTRIWGARSSEREIIYISGASFNINSTSIIAHEFGHMLQWGNDHSPEPEENPVKFWEDVWVDEGFSTFAALYLTEDIDKPDVMNGNPFFKNKTDLSLIHFETGDNYSSSLLFMLYMYEYFGGENYIRTLICNKQNGIAGVQSTLETLGYTEKFNNIFRSWTLANYLDNKFAGSGVYYYKHYNFPACKIRQTLLPDSISYNDSLKAYSSHYLKLEINTDSVLKLSVSGDKERVFIAALILIDTTSGNQQVVKAIGVGKDMTSYYLIDKNKEYFDELILCVMNVDSNLAVGKFTGYHVSISYYKSQNDVDEISADEIKTTFIENRLLINLGAFSERDCIVELFDINGHLINTDISSLNERKIDMSGNAPGLYLLRIKCGNSVFFRKIFYY
jgi:hypothetical protein